MGRPTHLPVQEGSAHRKPPFLLNYFLICFSLPPSFFQFQESNPGFYTDWAGILPLRQVLSLLFEIFILRGGCLGGPLK